MMPVFTDFGRQAHNVGAFPGNGMKMKFVARPAGCDPQRRETRRSDGAQHEG